MRILVSNYTQHKRKNSKTVTQISGNQYLIEGDIDYLRLGYVTDPIISYADIGSGPYLEVGKDFFGHGIIDYIEMLYNSNNHIIFKITLKEENTNE
jgi:hypothetical protein